MSQVDYYSTERRTLWERLLDSLGTRPEGDMTTLQLPADSLFAGTWGGEPTSVADVPDQVRAQIREEALLDAFNRLEASLRLLLYATTPGKEPPTAERCHQILNVWRYELEHRVNLVPDTYCGAVQRYESAMEAAYTIDGRCESGDLLRIRVPCWRMYDRVVIRGEAEILDEAEAEAHREAEASGQVVAAAPEAVAEAAYVVAEAPVAEPQEAPVAEAVEAPAPEPKSRRAASIPMARAQAEAAPEAEPEDAAGAAAGERYEAAAEPETSAVDEAGPAAD